MPPTVTITKVKHAGHPTVSYSGHIVACDEEMVVARCLWSLPHTYDLGPFLLEPGDVFTEHYYRGRWFNIFRIEDSAERLKGWYCNITRPPVIEREEPDWRIRWHDLALDLLVLPDGSHRLLDEDEYEALAPTPEQRAQVEEALATLLAWLAERQGPFCA